MQTDYDHLIPAAKVRQTFGISNRTLDGWCADGILPVYYLPGGHRRFMRSDVDELLRKSRARHDERIIELASAELESIELASDRVDA